MVIAELLCLQQLVHICLHQALHNVPGTRSRNILHNFILTNKKKGEQKTLRARGGRYAQFYSN